MYISTYIFKWIVFSKIALFFIIQKLHAPLQHHICIYIYIYTQAHICCRDPSFLRLFLFPAVISGLVHDKRSDLIILEITAVSLMTVWCNTRPCTHDKGQFVHCVYGGVSFTKYASGYR